MNILLWMGVGIGSLMVVLAILFFVMKRKNKAGKNLFLLYRTRDMEITDTITGEIYVDKVNPSKKEYVFPTFNGTRLPVTKPTKRINGVWYREVYLNIHGELSYIRGHYLDDKAHATSILEVKEKQLALYMYKEYQEQYQNPINKAQAVMVITMFLLAFIATAGAIYTTITFANNTEDIVVIAKENNKVASTNKQSAAVMVDLVERMAVIASYLAEDVNITRVI